MLRTCTECGTDFHGRADARYCSPACRQRAHRERNRPYVPEPIVNKDGCAKVCDHKRLRATLILSNYDPHRTVDEILLADPDFEPYRSEWADWIDDTIEWLSVIRDGLRGMDWPQRATASARRCGKNTRYIA